MGQTERYHRATEPGTGQAKTRDQPSEQEEATDGEKRARFAMDRICGHGDDAGACLLFPVGLMIFNPTLMFERGWEQYVGTGIYFWAVLTLSRELWRLWRNEQAFEDSPALLKRVTAAIAPASCARRISRAERRSSTTTIGSCPANPPVDEFFEGDAAAPR